MKKKPQSQLMELFLSIAEELGLHSDQDIASLADVSPENVANWRSGAVKEFKTQKFLAAKHNLAAHLRSLRAQAGLLDPNEDVGLSPLEIEEGAGPADLQRQFRDRVVYDYLGHRFLYFEPQGALAWEKLIGAGYGQDYWLAGVADCARAWLDSTRDGTGQPSGPIARELGLARRDKPRGLDLVSLGPGEGGKEVVLMRALLDVEEHLRQRCNWLTYAPVDVSIPLLMVAANSARRLFAGCESAYPYRSVLPFCADFEEGALAFRKRLRTSLPSGEDGLRLVLFWGNTLGNVRDEEHFVRKKLARLVRPGDLVWFEVGLRAPTMEDDPLYRMTVSRDTETAGDASRRLLLEGPYRRQAAAIGRPMPDLDLRVWLRENDDSSRIPGSCNFCHDLIIKEERRVCTMLYSRRYRLEELSQWFERTGYQVLGLRKSNDSLGRARVAHLLLQRAS